jgi:putative lipoic acid-binding regulatory protein
VTETQILQFPSDFPIKIMGPRVDGFAQAIAEVVQRHAPDFNPATLELRASSGGNYVSVTATVRATSREQLDDLYRALTGHPLVRVVL